MKYIQYFRRNPPLIYLTASRFIVNVAFQTTTVICQVLF